jgi:hypothetical protein
VTTSRTTLHRHCPNGRLPLPLHVTVHDGFAPPGSPMELINAAPSQLQQLNRPLPQATRKKGCALPRSFWLWCDGLPTRMACECPSVPVPRPHPAHLTRACRWSHLVSRRRLSPTALTGVESTKSGFSKSAAAILSRSQKVLGKTATGWPRLAPHAYRSEEGEGEYITPAGRSGLQKIASFGCYPRWSPDSSRILFLPALFLGRPMCRLDGVRLRF